MVHRELALGTEDALGGMVSPVNIAPTMTFTGICDLFIPGDTPQDSYRYGNHLGRVHKQGAKDIPHGKIPEISLKGEQSAHQRRVSLAAIED
jgi:hypothetical protein